jgi:hypothetical protein
MRGSGRDPGRVPLTLFKRELSPTMRFPRDIEEVDFPDVDVDDAEIVEAIHRVPDR